MLLNDPSFVEASRVLAGRMLNACQGDDQQRIAWLWQQVLGRDATADEQQSLTRLIEKHRHEYHDNPTAAEQLTSIGLSPTASSDQVVEQAAWTSVCRVLLNLSETITRN